jgi:thioredoxin-related protein
MVFKRAFAGIVLAALWAVQAAAFELVMVEQKGCHYCQEWNAVIGPIYPKTPEGKYAPLRQIDLHEPLPEDLSFETKVVFTPTFILVEDGVEVARIEGYPGEDMFWWFLSKLMTDNTDFQGGPS